MKKMKWGRKKNSQSQSPSPLPSSTTGLPSISQVFPISWFSKFKQMSGKSKSQPAKTNVNSSRLYDGEVVDDDAYWRLSFGGESFKGKTYRSVLFDSDDELDESPLSNCRSCRNKKEDTQRFTNMVSDIRKMKILSDEDQEEILLETPRKKIQKGRKVIVRKLRKTNRRNLQVCSSSGGESNEVSRRATTETVEKNVINLEPVKTIQTVKNDHCSSTASGSRKSHYISSSNSMQKGRTNLEEDQEFPALNLKKENRNVEEFDGDLDLTMTKESKIQDLLIKNEKQRRSLGPSREEQRRRSKQSCKVKAYSPRTALKIEICKIRALEDLKKAKMKNKGRRTAEAKPDLESYAMVKCSFDPQKDFRDSMVEMIAENQIGKPEELEELLACYLSLNSEEYHDVIIKVFKQVWFDLNRTCLSPDWLS